MIRNHLKIAWRTLIGAPAQSAIVIGGLAMSLVVVLLIFLWAKNELSYDSYHTDADRIFLLCEVAESDGWIEEEGPYPIYDALQAEIPEVERAAVAIPGTYMDLVFQVGSQPRYERELLFVDSNWFDLFDYQLVAGSFDHFRQEAHVMAMSESKAKQYFGAEPAIGKVIVVDSIPTTVVALFADIPANSSFRQEILMPHRDLLKKVGYQRFADEWAASIALVFTKLHESTAAEAVASKITSIFRTHHPYRKDGSHHHQLVGLMDIHLGGHGFASLPKGNKRTIAVFSALAFLLLVTASVNVVNLATARMTARHKEVGIRKVTGATRGQLFGQVMTETLLTIAICAVLTVLLLVVTLPHFNRYYETALRFSLLDTDTVLIAIATFSAVALLTGIYPALLMGKANPLSLFKGKTIGQTDNKWLRDALVVGQLVLAIAMLVGVTVIRDQFKYIQRTAGAYQMDQVFSFRKPYMGEMIRQGSPEQQAYIHRLNTIKQDMQRHSAIKAVTRVNGASLIDQKHKQSTAFEWIGHPNSTQKPDAVLLWIDHDYPKLADIQLVAGRWFDPANTADKQNIVINETSVKTFGLQEPVVGTAFNVLNIYQGTIIGVVKDFHHASIHQPIEPVILELDHANMGGKFMVAAEGGRIDEALAAARTAWQRFYPGHPFEYTFLDEEFERLYKDDRKALVFSLVFAGLSVLVSALGILAMAMFMAQRKTKEIGIRKVLGASIPSIVMMLSKNSAKLVAIAFLLASPIAWWALNTWLDGFAYRIEVQWWMFAVAGLATAAVVLVTVGWRAVRAAVANPVESLRDE